MVEITTAESKDAERIIGLQRLAYQSEAKLYNDWSLPALTQTLDSLLQEFESSLILKATMNNEIIGSVRATVEENSCKIGRLIVDPKFQRQGIGSKLLKHIEAMHKNAKVFELFTGSKSINNIRLYEKHGYVVTHTQPLSDAVSVTFLAKRSDILQKKLRVSPRGFIKVHGQRNELGWLSAISQQFNWTNGCIALTNSEKDEFMDLVEVGTTIKIQ